MTLQDELTQALLLIERVQPKTLVTMESNLKIAQEKILNLINSTQNKRTIRRELKKILNEAFELLSPMMLEDIETATDLTWDKVSVIMAGYVTTTIKVPKFKSIDDVVKKKLVNPNNLILGNTIDDLKNNMILSANNKLRGAILNGFESNKGVDGIAKDISAVIGGINRNTLKTISKTAILNNIEGAKNELFESYFKDEILFYRYSSSIDGRTSKYCLMANGYTTKDKKTAKYKPKTHWNCRSVWLPATELSEKIDKEQTQNLVQFDSRTVNHRDGTTSTKFKVDKVKQVPRNLSGVKMFEYFDESYKKKYLGSTRYKLYKEGKASLQEMIDISKNKFIPLKDLKNKLN